MFPDFMDVSHASCLEDLCSAKADSEGVCHYIKRLAKPCLESSPELQELKWRNESFCCKQDTLLSVKYTYAYVVQPWNVLKEWNTSLVVHLV